MNKGFPRLKNLLLNGEERRGEGWGIIADGWKAEADRALELTPECMAELEYWEWFLEQEDEIGGERMAALFLRFVK